jgi:hypothetical protein
VDTIISLFPLSTATFLQQNREIPTERLRLIADCHKLPQLWMYLMSGVGTASGVRIMLRSFALLGILVVTAPTLAVAADNQNNNSDSQNSNSLQFTGDPPAANFNSKGVPAGFPPVPGCNVLATDPDDRNGLNGDDKKSVVGNPHCQPASP